MLSRLLNWVPVLFGLKFAGVASVATVSDVVAGETKVPVSTSEMTDEAKTSKNRAENRMTSGSAVTRLMTSTATIPAAIDAAVLTESFVFAEASDEPAVEDTATQAPRKAFVARPISSKAPRPAERINAVKAAKVGSVIKQPGQTKQANRPKARADLKVQGKKASKRIAWIAKRTPAPSMSTNVVQFPMPVTAEKLRRAA